MRRSYKFLLRPTARQEQALQAMLRDHRVLYNAALQERRDAYRHPSRTSVRYGEQSAQLAHAQRHLAKFPKRTRARDRTKQHRQAARTVTKLNAKLRRQRADYHHKVALDLVRSYDVIACEDLNISGMTRAPEPKPDPQQPGTFTPNGAAAKAGLNRSILDAGWGLFLGTLGGKAEKAGRRVVPVNARNTSRTCPQPCGYMAADNRVSQADFVCQRCGFTANADVVGAVNIRSRAGLVLPGAE